MGNADRDFTDAEYKALKQLAQSVKRQWPTRRDALKMGGVGLAAAGVGSAATGAAMGQADTNDSDGNIGTPSNRVDLFADGVNIDSQVTWPDGSTTTTSPSGSGGGYSVENVVADHSATGDGVADDTAEIQAALDAADTASGGVVYLPPGTYKISSRLTVYDNVSIAGDGPEVSVIQADSAGFKAIRNEDVALANSPDTNILIQGLSILGQSTSADSGSDRGVLLANVRRTFIRNVYVDGFNAHGLELAAARYSGMQWCWTNETGDDGISVSDAYYADTDDAGPGAESETRVVGVVNCTVDNTGNNGFETDDGPKWVYFVACHARSGVGGHGFYVHFHDSSNTTFDQAQYPPKSIHFINCTCESISEGIGTDSTRTSADGSDIERVTFVGCDFSEATTPYNFDGDVERRGAPVFKEVQFGSVDHGSLGASGDDGWDTQTADSQSVTFDWEFSETPEVFTYGLGYALKDDAFNISSTGCSIRAANHRTSSLSADDHKWVAFTTY